MVCLGELLFRGWFDGIIINSDWFCCEELHNFVNVIILVLLTGRSIVGFGERNEEFNDNAKTIFKSRNGSNDCGFGISYKYEYSRTTIINPFARTFSQRFSTQAKRAFHRCR